MRLASIRITAESDTGGVHSQLKASVWREHRVLPVRKVMHTSHRGDGALHTKCSSLFVPLAPSRCR